MYSFNIAQFANEMCTYTPDPFEAEWDYFEVDHVKAGITVRLDLPKSQKLLTCTITFKELDDMKRQGSIEGVFALAFYNQLKKMSIVVVQ